MAARKDKSMLVIEQHRHLYTYEDSLAYAWKNGSTVCAKSDIGKGLIER